MLTVSRQLVVALKLGKEPQYRVALRADMHPAVLSRLVNGAERIRPGDPRVLRVAALLGVHPDQAFDEA